MHSGFDTHTDLNSPLHRWQPQAKLIGLGGLIFAFAAVTKLVLLPPMLGVTTGYYLAARLPLRLLLQRLRYPGWFLLGIVLLLPWLSGETVLWQWGPLALRQEGCLAMLLISGRFLSIFTLGLILLSTTPFLTLIKAMRSLGLPPTLTDMTLLAYRYLYDIADQLTTMRTAMQLRGFGQQRRWLNGRDFSRLAALTGTLLIRSYEHSEQVYKAMRLRGYGSATSRLSSGQKRWWTGLWSWRNGHTRGLLLTAAIALSFVLAEIWF